MAFKNLGFFQPWCFNIQNSLQRLFQCGSQKAGLVKYDKYTCKSEQLGLGCLHTAFVTHCFCLKFYQFALEIILYITAFLPNVTFDTAIGLRFRFGGENFPATDRLAKVPSHCTHWLKSVGTLMFVINPTNFVYTVDACYDVSAFQLIISSDRICMYVMCGGWITPFSHWLCETKGGGVDPFPPDGFTTG